MSLLPRLPAPPRPLLLQPMLAPLIALLVALASLAVGSLASPADVVAWTAEEGFIERSTVMLYFFAGLAVAGERERLHAPLWVAMAALLAAAAARELDWHKAFTGTSILKLSYFLSAAPMQHKLAAAGVLAGVGAAVAFLALRFARGLWRGLRTGDAVASTAVTILACLVTSKLVDRSLTVAAQDWDLSISAQARALQLAIEEFMELEVPFLVVLGLVQRRMLAGRADLLARQAAASHLVPRTAGATAMHPGEAPHVAAAPPRG